MTRFSQANRLPSSQAVLPVLEVVALVRAADEVRCQHPAEEPDPDGHEGVVHAPRLRRLEQRRQAEALHATRLSEPVEQRHAEVEHRHEQELVVEEGDIHLAQELEQAEDAQAVEGAEHRASQPAAGRGRRIGDEEVKTQEDRDRDAGVDEEVDAGNARVDEVGHDEGGRREQGHDRHREEELHYQAGHEDRDVHVGRVGQRRRDLGAPGEVRRPGEDQAE